AVVQGPGDLPQLDLEAFLYLEGANFHGWTISNLDVRDFDFSIGMSALNGGAFDDVKVIGNHIRVATDLNGTTAPRDSLQNVGIQYAAAPNQLITNNQIDIPGDGLSAAGATDFDATPWKFATSVGVQSQSA